MRIAEDDNCCTLLHLVNFGQEVINYDTMATTVAESETYDIFVSKCRKAISSFDRRMNLPVNRATWPRDYPGALDFKNRAVLMATTIHHQVLAEEFLAKIGFTKFGPIYKNKHKENLLSVWTISISDFLTNLEAAEELKQKEAA